MPGPLTGVRILDLGTAGVGDLNAFPFVIERDGVTGWRLEDHDSRRGTFGKL